MLHVTKLSGAYAKVRTGKVQMFGVLPSKTVLTWAQMGGGTDTPTEELPRL